MTNPQAGGELADCPWCRSGIVKIHEWIFGAVVICMNCETRGPKFESGDKSREEMNSEAVARWNTRHESPRLAALRSLADGVDAELMIRVSALLLIDGMDEHSQTFKHLAELKRALLATEGSDGLRRKH